MSAGHSIVFGTESKLYRLEHITNYEMPTDDGYIDWLFDWYVYLCFIIFMILRMMVI